MMEKTRTLEDYVALLRRHDWKYVYSDDHASYLEGSKQRRELELMQRELDPEFKIWEVHAK